MIDEARRPVAVTGLGAVAPHGADAAVVFDAVCAGNSAVRLIEEDLVAAPCSHAEDSWFMRLPIPGIDRVSQLAVGAAESAIADALAHGDRLWPEDRTGVYVGTGFGGAATVENAYRRFHDGAKLSPLSVIASMANAPAALIAMRSHVRGPVLTHSVACASGASAIAAGAQDIANGIVDRAIVGGSEALLVPGMLAAWKAMQALAPPLADDPGATCRPFSRSRNGLTLGEGAAFLILEDLHWAKRRGARIYAELAGSGISCDAAHLFRPESGGQITAMNAAIAAAGLGPGDVGYCNAHGTGTIVGDSVEAQSIRAVWGTDLSSLLVSSTKGLHGHLLGASGALEALITVLALHRRMLPPNSNCPDPDMAYQLPLVLKNATHAPSLNAAISNSFAFGGTNVVLAFRRHEGGSERPSSARVC